MADNYSVGNLEVRINAMSDKAVSSLSNVVEQLERMNSALRVISGNDFKWLNSLGTKMKHLGEKMAEIDWTRINKGFASLTESITPFIDKVNSANASLQSLATIIANTSGSKISNIEKRLDVDDRTLLSATKVKKSMSFGMSIGRIALVTHYLKRLARGMATIVDRGSAYTETLNMWQVSMRNNLEVADEFIKKMNKAYGISTETLMRTQAIFKNMIGSLGQISEQVAYQISESFTQMALDFSSLYNVTFESAIRKFQAVLAGQVRPIRSVSGYDITETTLFGLYQQLGGTKSMRQLNRTEKQLLSILAVFNQMEASGAIGDLAKTLGSFANQSRMLAENWKEMTTWIGIGVKLLIEQSGLLKYINAGLIIASELAKSFVFAMGYEVPDFLQDIFEKTEGENDALDETGNQLDKIKGKLLGFDKFRSLQGQGQSDLPIDEVLLKALKNYKSVLGKVKNEARDLAESFLSTLGFVDTNNDGIYEMNDGVKSLIQGIKELSGALKPLLRPLIGLLRIILDLLKPILEVVNTLLGSLLQGVADALTGLMPILQLLVGVLDVLAKTLASVVIALTDVISFNWDRISSDLGNLWGVKGSVKGYANGGVPDKGSLFVAGESGAELIGNMGNGNTGVMNMQQMENAVARGMIRAYKQTNREETIQINMDGEKIFKAVKSTAQRQGLGFSEI